jgi:thiol-disulfide isomerase/thioredoxin
MASDRAAPPNRATRRAALASGVALLGAGAFTWRPAHAAHAVRSWPAGRPVPPLDLVDLAGKRWRLEELTGQVVVLNFWATWCEPCRIEMPSLEAMAARRRADRVVVAAVNYREAPEAIRGFLERAPFRPPILLDRDGEVGRRYQLRSLPTSFVIDRKGVIREVILGGPISAAVLQTKLDPLLDEAP